MYRRTHCLDVWHCLESDVVANRQILLRFQAVFLGDTPCVSASTHCLDVWHCLESDVVANRQILLRFQAVFLGDTPCVSAHALLDVVVAFFPMEGFATTSSSATQPGKPRVFQDKGRMIMDKRIPTGRLVSTILLPLFAVASGSTAVAAEPSPRAAIFSAGDLRLSVEASADGIRLTSLSDTATKTELLAAKPAPLFTLTLREGPTGQETRLDADTGWSRVEITSQSEKELQLQWLAAKDERLEGIHVTAKAVADDSAHAIRWHLEVQNASQGWGVWRVLFPQAAIADLGGDACAFLPRGPGEVQPGLWRRPFQFRDTYPGAWMTMQFMAAYDRVRKTGLYIGLHDPSGSTKDLAVESRPAEKSVLFQFDVPAVNMGQPGAGMRFDGEAVWQLIRGDWFDAAVIYRDWVREKAGWYPALGAEGRSDTVPEMRTLSAWASGVRTLGLPVVHPRHRSSRRSRNSPSCSGCPWGCTGTVGIKFRSTTTTPTTSPRETVSRRR